ncbi:hypothetical protein [Streptomyces sp. NPDC087307]|uniref:hypothetical protein n=1 Tax=Streptomyces sp. NPDC087307 TaxID=3365782 RepID=UPI0037F5D92C
MPSRTRTRRSRSEGRTKLSNGPTTVGPDTTRIAHSITAAPLDMPSTGVANSAADSQMISVPSQTSQTSQTSLTTMRRVWHRSRPIPRPGPAS